MILPVVAALAAGGLAGCGDDGTDEEQITSAAQKFASDIRSENWKGVCDSFSKSAKGQVQAAAEAAQIADCPTFMQRAFSANAGVDNLADVKPEDVKVTKIVIKGNKATADVVPSNDPDPSTNFVKEDGKWKIAGDDPPPEDDKDETTPSTTGAGSG